MARLKAFSLVALVPLLAAWGTPDHQIRYSRDRGGSCAAMIPFYGPERLWTGHFAGGRPVEAEADRDFVDWRVADTCFFDRIDCETWLARVQRGWPMRPGFAWCATVEGGRTVVSPGAKGPLKR
ncbi:hypothetical protein [Alsobacter ponti]|nr:hypothetical protein [Alsobacter ponti]